MWYTDNGDSGGGGGDGGDGKKRSLQTHTYTHKIDIVVGK